MLSTAEIDWIERSIGSGARLREAVPLAGAVASKPYRCTVELAGSLTNFVLRRHTMWGGGCGDPEMARQEAWALTTASTVDIPAPGLIAFDTGGEDHCPLTLMSFLPGRVDLHPTDVDAWLGELSRAMFVIHQTPADDAPCDYFPWFFAEKLAPPAWSKQPDAWARAIEVALGPAPVGHAHFIHRDFHPCNVLFEDGRVSGVVDWPNACRGQAGVDIAHCRWNLALMYGVDMADRFVDAYRDLTDEGWEYHPYFDLVEICEKTFEPNVYPGWPAFGLTGLTAPLMVERTEALLSSALGRL